MKLIVKLIAFTLTLSGCMNTQYAFNTVDNISRDLILTCIDAHVSSETGFWNEAAAMPVRREIDVVDIWELNRMKYYTVVFSMSQPYPDGPNALCHVGNVENGVLYLSYDNPGNKTVEIDLGIGALKEDCLMAHDRDAIKKASKLPLNSILLRQSN